MHVKAGPWRAQTAQANSQRREEPRRKTGEVPKVATAPGASEKWLFGNSRQLHLSARAARARSPSCAGDEPASAEAAMPRNVREARDVDAFGTLYKNTFSSIGQVSRDV